MSHPLSLRKALRSAVILLPCLLMTGCYSLKNVEIQRIPAGRPYLVVHADTNYWIVQDYSVTDGILTARLCPEDVKIRNKNSAHAYVAPAEAVTPGDTVLSVPAANIAKTDFKEIEEAQTAGAIVVWLVTIGTVILLLLP